uniref:Uncharacterized protein n=1 Tax=Sphaerodactylus townsendi TaxID=933632 RepID=A0ACB8E6C8_9SAUR
MWDSSWRPLLWGQPCRFCRGGPTPVLELRKTLAQQGERDRPLPTTQGLTGVADGTAVGARDPGDPLGSEVLLGGSRTYAQVTGGSNPWFRRSYRAPLSHDYMEDEQMLAAYYDAMQVQEEEACKDRKFMVRVQYKGEPDSIFMSREYFVGHFLIGKMEVPAADLRAVSIPPGIPEADIMFCSEAVYQQFWDSCRAAQCARDSDFNFLELQPLSGETRVMTVYLSRDPERYQQDWEAESERRQQREEEAGCQAAADVQRAEFRRLEKEKEQAREHGRQSRAVLAVLASRDRHQAAKASQSSRQGWETVSRCKQDTKGDQAAWAARPTPVLRTNGNRYTLLQSGEEDEEMQQGGEQNARRDSDREIEVQEMEWLPGSKRADQHDPRGSKRKQ